MKSVTRLFVINKKLFKKPFEDLKEVHVKPSDALNAYLQSCGFEPMQRGMTEYQLLKRPKVKISDLTDILPMWILVKKSIHILKLR